ncbi:hypothetical protein L596_002227 [Steinernema carpocapsae]|uniref:Uncharacterized protein n=1 Tax=Steinernema carpocapsae TaxID=34508 RepID=A0A4U8UPN0_STECR|nr:hypothetical protein L596_002227 [Steinernema carpocapsae]
MVSLHLDIFSFPSAKRRSVFVPDLKNGLQTFSRRGRARSAVGAAPAFYRKVSPTTSTPAAAAVISLLPLYIANGFSYIANTSTSRRPPVLDSTTKK